MAKIKHCDPTLNDAPAAKYGLTELETDRD
jgi:hypothetical protein